MASEKLYRNTFELKDQCLPLRLKNDSLRYTMLCQDYRHYVDSKRPGDTVEEYSCPSCIGVHRLKMKQGRERITKLLKCQQVHSNKPMSSAGSPSCRPGSVQFSL